MPLLGDVPLLGSLFSVEHTNQEKRDLYVVVTPHIVAGAAGASAATNGPPDAHTVSRL